MAIQPGTDIGRYHILEQLGEGGMAVVYRAYDTHLDCDVALKVIRLENLPAVRLEKTLQRFQSEARRMARMTHSNIVKVIDYGEFEGTPYLVMPFLPGGTLKEQMGKPMPWQQAIKIIKPIAEALGYAHEKGVIHRDIKPSNILITESGNPMLSDFGIAKILDDNVTRELTTTGIGIGTPEYMAPEQALGGEIDARADVYALGIVFYELLTGRKPFEASTPMAVLIKQARDPLPHPSSFNPAITQDIERILVKALAKEPEHRFQNMGEIIKALDKNQSEPSVSNKLPIDNFDKQKSSGTSGTIKRNSGKFPVMAMVVLGIGLISAAAFFLTRQPGKTTSDVYTASPSQPAQGSSTEISAPSEQNQIITDGEMKVAILAPLSGPVPSFGESINNGALLAIDDWNKSGGVLGKKIIPVIEDSQCTAEPAINAANKVIFEDNVHYILGETCSAASIPVSEIAEENGVVQISPTSTNPNVTLNPDGSTKQYVFRTCFIDSFQGRVAAEFAMQQGYQTAFIMNDPGNEYVNSINSEFISQYTILGGKIIGKASYSGSDSDFTGALSQAKNLGADLIFLPDYYNIVNLVAQQAKAMGLQAVIMGADGWDSSDLDLSAADGYYYINHYSPSDSRPINQDWIHKYVAEYGYSPDALATLSYDTTNLLLEAIQQTGEDDPAKVKNTLASIEFSGVTGMITFDKYHNPIKNAVVLGISNGGVEFIDSISPN